MDIDSNTCRRSIWGDCSSPSIVAVNEDLGRSQRRRCRKRWDFFLLHCSVIPTYWDCCWRGYWIGNGSQR